MPFSAFTDVKTIGTFPDNGLPTDCSSAEPLLREDKVIKEADASSIVEFMRVESGGVCAYNSSSADSLVSTFVGHDLKPQGNIFGYAHITPSLPLFNSCSNVNSLLLVYRGCHFHPHTQLITQLTVTQYVVAVCKSCQC